MTVRRWDQRESRNPQTVHDDDEGHPFEDAIVLAMRFATLVLVAYLAATW